MLTANQGVAGEPSMEQIDLEVLALTLEADDLNVQELPASLYQRMVDSLAYAA